MKKIRKLLGWFIAVPNMVAAVALLVCSYSDHLNPASFPLLSVSGLVFPIVLVINIAFLVLWLLVSWRGAVIPIATLLLCLPAIRLYFPVNRQKDIPEGAVKVLSYNVLMYGPWGLAQGEENPIARYILDCDADIVCLQEASSVEAGGKKLEAMFNERYPYCDVSSKKGGEWLTLYSKYPILSKDTIALNSHGNMSVAYVLDIDGEETLVVNNHLETVGFSAEEKGQFKRMVERQMSEDDAKATSRSLIHKLEDASVRRAAQAEEVARVIARHRELGRSVIVCGDFNDSPLSYAHHTIAKGLTDCYAASGNGPGYTYQQNGMNVRIDHILCSKEWVPYGARVDKEVDTSDHFPISCWLKKQAKQ